MTKQIKYLQYIECMFEVIKVFVTKSEWLVSVSSRELLKKSIATLNMKMNEILIFQPYFTHRKAVSE